MNQMLAVMFVLSLASLLSCAAGAQGVELGEVRPYTGILCTSQSAAETIGKIIAENATALQETYGRLAASGDCEERQAVPVTFVGVGPTYSLRAKMVTIYRVVLTDKSVKHVFWMWNAPSFECVRQTRDGICT